MKKILILLTLLTVTAANGADYPYTFATSASDPVDSLYFVRHIDLVAQDTSRMFEDVTRWDTTFSYTTGDYLQMEAVWKWYEDDSTWVSSFVAYNSATAATLDSADVYISVAAVLNDSTSKYQGGMGSGQYSITMRTYDSMLTQTIPWVGLAIWDEAQGSLLGAGRTGTDGLKTANLDNGNYVAVATAAGYEFTAYDTFTVSGAATYTVYGSWRAPGSPTSPQTCRVYGYIYANPSGDSAQVRTTVSFELVSMVANVCDSAIYQKPTTTVKTAASGYFYADLNYSSCWTDTIMYEMTIEGRPNDNKLITVPDSTTYRIIW